MKQHLEEILRKMCGFVGADFETINFKEKEWYLKYQWTAEQENEFKKWLYGYLKNHKKAQMELFETTLPPKLLKKEVELFILSYGWRCD